MTTPITTTHDHQHPDCPVCAEPRTEAGRALLASFRTPKARALTLQAAVHWLDAADILAIEAEAAAIAREAARPLPSSEAALREALAFQASRVCAKYGSMTPPNHCETHWSEWPPAAGVCEWQQQAQAALATPPPPATTGLDVAALVASGAAHWYDPGTDGRGAAVRSLLDTEPADWSDALVEVTTDDLVTLADRLHQFLLRTDGAIYRRTHRCPSCPHPRSSHSQGGMCNGEGSACYCVRFPDSPDEPETEDPTATLTPPAAAERKVLLGSWDEHPACPPHGPCLVDPTSHHAHCAWCVTPSEATLTPPADAQDAGTGERPVWRGPHAYRCPACVRWREKVAARGSLLDQDRLAVERFAYAQPATSAAERPDEVAG